MTDRREKRKLIRKITLASLAALLLVALGLFLIHRWEIRSQERDAQGQTATEYYMYKGEKYKPKDVESILLIGIDKFAGEVTYDSYNNQQQADFLLLLVLDPKEKTCTPVHLNRDTITPVTVLSVLGEPIGTVDEQLALAHTYGSGGQDSCVNTVQAVATLLDVPVDHYLSVTMDAVQELNDMVGGVTVLVEDDYSVVDFKLIQGQENLLLGKHALSFVRSRGGMEDNSNLARMKRQRLYLDGLHEQYLSAMKSDDSFAWESVLKLNEYLVSDCTAMQLSDMVNDTLAYQMEPIWVLEGNAMPGEKFMEYYVDEDAMEELVISLFYERVE